MKTNKNKFDVLKFQTLMIGKKNGRKKMRFVTFL